jgi:alpha-tubulin suppressor-like RCC1 family protein
MSTPFRFKNADNTTVDFEDYYVRADYFRSGNLWLWGFNFRGELGDNTTIKKSSPVQTIAWGSNWKQVACGSYYAAGIKTDGTLWTWGIGTTYGNLGNNTATNMSSPVQTIAFGTNWKSVDCGQTITAAIKTDGTLWAWGDNAYGSLGDNTTISKSSPVQTITFGTNWMKVVCGSYHCAAIKTDGTLWAWGRNTYGQLGDNSVTHRSSPVQTIAGGTNWKNVDCGYRYIAAIKTDGTLWIWGDNTYGQLGDNTITRRSSPVQTIAGGTNWKQVSCGQYHTASVKTDGTLWTWGRGDSGQLGDNTAIARSSPVQTIAYGTNWKSVSAGNNSVTAAIKTDGTLWLVGGNSNGDLGDNTIVSKSSPVQTIMYGTNWKEVSAGQDTAAIQYQDDYQ